MRRIFPIIVLLTVLLPMASAEEALPLYTSVDLEVDAKLVSYDELPSLMGQGRAVWRLGYDFDEHWSLYGLVGRGFALEALPLSDFLTYPALNGFMLGLGGLWRTGRFSLSLEIGMGLVSLAGSRLIEGEMRMVPKYTFLVLEDSPIGYALGFPLSAGISADGWIVSAGIAFCMEVGMNLDSRSPKKGGWGIS